MNLLPYGFIKNNSFKPFGYKVSYSLRANSYRYFVVDGLLYFNFTFPLINNLSEKEDEDL